MSDLDYIDTPTYVIYHELILTSKEYMTHVTAVDAYWLGKVLPSIHTHVGRLKCLCFVAEVGSVFYSVTEKKFDERGNRRIADRKFSKLAELETEMAKQREE